MVENFEGERVAGIPAPEGQAPKLAGPFWVPQTQARGCRCDVRIFFLAFLRWQVFVHV